jgi:Flp pilus assembly secretin CpaC
MRVVTFAALVLSSSLGFAEELNVPLRTVTSVPVGRHTILPLPPGVRSATTADSKVAIAQVLSDGEVLVTGISRGRTTITIKGAAKPDVTYDLSVEAMAAMAPSRPSDMVALGVGYQKSFLAPDVKRVAVGDPKVADVTVVDGKEILLTGIAPGRTSLLVWRTNDVRSSYVVKVEEKPTEEVLKEIRELLGPMEGVRLRIIGERIFMDGEVETPEDGVLVKKVCALYPTELVCM